MPGPTGPQAQVWCHSTVRGQDTAGAQASPALSLMPGVSPQDTRFSLKGAVPALGFVPLWPMFPSWGPI